MSLDKAIIHKKERRKPYRKSQVFDRSCRNHGHCCYCYNNRTFKNQRGLVASSYYKNWEDLQDYDEPEP